jgi:hypothetical protein
MENSNILTDSSSSPVRALLLKKAVAPFWLSPSA